MQEYKITPIERLIKINSVITAFNAERQKGFYFSGEMHNFWELVYVVSGHVMATADEKVFSLSAGQLLFHKPMEFHRIWSESDTSPRLCIISFDAAGDGMKNFEDKQITLTPMESERFLNIVASFKKVIRALGAPDYYDQKKFSLLANQTTLEFEDLLLSLIGREAKQITEKTSYISQYEYIVKVMNEHSSEALTQEDIARLCNFSLSNLKKIFHMYSDIGVMKYFTSIKLRRAMQMLYQGLSIQQISDSLGFSSTNYFHAVFKKETGMTPKEYVNKITSNSKIKRID